MAIMKPDDIDELFSELTKESRAKYAEYTAQNIKPKYIELVAGKYALNNVIVQSISTSQLKYDEHQRTYFVYCKPFQPFVNNIIRHWDAGTIRPLKLALVSATTNKVAIMHVGGVKVTKHMLDMTTEISITLELDKESNTDDINSTGIRMKMNVLGNDYELGDELITKRAIAKQYEDAVTAARHIKEIEDQKKADAEKVSSYKEVFSALTALSKTDSSLAYADPDAMISKFLSVIMKADS